MAGNSWRIDATRVEPDLEEPVCWMTRCLGDGWEIAVRLHTNHYRTVIDQLHVYPTDTPTLFGVRGHIELPAGDPTEPSWQRYPIPTLRREASAALEQLLEELTRTSQDRLDAQTRGEPPSSDQREPVDRALAFIAGMRGFTPEGTRPRRRTPRTTRNRDLAIVAAAYAAARAETPTNPREGTRLRLEEVGLHYARSSIGPLITKTRTAGMLTRAQHGKAAGRLTPKARRTLKDANFHAPWYDPTPTAPPRATSPAHGNSEGDGRSRAR
jgi:hypothetical protein